MKLLLPALLLPAVSFANSPFDGTWIIQPELTKFSLRPLSMTLDDHVYRRTSCVSALEVPADGTEHTVEAAPDLDAISVHVVDARRMEISRKLAGKLTWKGLYTVSPDQHSMTLEFIDDSAPRTVTGVLLYTRESSVMPGLHSLSGTWRPEKISKLSASSLTMTFRETTNGLAMDASDGRSYDAKFDRQYYPLRGDATQTTVSVGHINPTTIQINRKRDAILLEVSRATVSDDGRTMTLVELDRQCQAATTFTLQKQPAS
jgi:hypothetical protein